jgi:catechol 2,3-dioxygenase-like lactoylglutathione lyase family enzyme
MSRIRIVAASQNRSRIRPTGELSRIFHRSPSRIRRPCGVLRDLALRGNVRPVKPPLQAEGFHVGMIVRSIEEHTDYLTRLLGSQLTMWEVTKPAIGPFGKGYEDSRLRISYGRYAGMTLEFVQPVEGRGPHAAWLEQHGEGVNHFGFWVPDVAEATKRALELGATLTSAAIDGSTGVLTLDGASPEQIAGALVPGMGVFVGGVGNVQLELLGPATETNLKREFGDQLSEIVTLPSWRTTPDS